MTTKRQDKMLLDCQNVLKRLSKKPQSLWSLGKAVGINAIKVTRCVKLLKEQGNDIKVTTEWNDNKQLVTYFTYERPVPPSDRPAKREAT